jgi:DegV family protein with EDD domain
MPAKQDIALVADSSACLPPGLASALGIRILPITVHLPDADYLDGVDRLSRGVYRALERDEPVKSSPPSVVEYFSAIEEAGSRPVIVVTPAAEFTTMHRNARLAAEMAGTHVTVVDSRTAAAGQGLVVLAGAGAAEAGASPAEVVRTMEHASTRVDLVASLENLGPIRRSGRVPSAALDVAGRLGVCPVFRMRFGSVEPLASPTDTGAALSRIQREWVAGGGPDADSSAIFHADCHHLAKDLERRLGCVDHMVELSAAMSIHTGPSVVGAAWLEPEATRP